MTFIDKIKGFLISRKESGIERSTDSVAIDVYEKRGKGIITTPVEINVSSAIRIELPKLKFEREPDPFETVKQDWSMYYEILQKAQSHYNREWFDKAKDEFLKIYDLYHKDKMYYTYLLRTYRKIVDRFIEKKKYNDALLELEDMFKKCVNYTNSDIDRFNKVANHLNKDNKDKWIELKSSLIMEEPDYSINSSNIFFLQEAKKRRGFKIPITKDGSILTLKAKSGFIPYSVPHIEFDQSRLVYNQLEVMSSIPFNAYRFRESSNRNGFIASSVELMIYLYDWDMKLLQTFDASKYSDSHTQLRRIELSAELSYFIFTVIDKVYLLDAGMNLLSVWQIPNKDGFVKQKMDQPTIELDTQLKACLKILELPNRPTKEEIKSSFRRLILKFHPDRNPDNPQAGEKAKQLIEAYEYLSGEDAQNAFEGVEKEQYHWVDINSIRRFELGGITIEMSFTSGSGEDWIYGAGISNDGKRIYLGAYSGKIYQINHRGIAQKIYHIPEDKNSNYGQSNPVSYVLEYNDRLYILSSWYLYVLKDDKTIKHIKNNNELFRWYGNGFVQQGKNEVVFYDIDGNNLGKISFKSPINQICFNNDIILVETTTKAFTFKMDRKPL